MAKQYCRYCNNLTYGDVPYCSVRKKVLSESYAKSTNRCKFFELNPIDAFYENLKGYRARGPRHLFGAEAKQIFIDEMFTDMERNDE